MKRIRRNPSIVILSKQATEMVASLAQTTGFTANVTASRLIELGTYYLTRTSKSAEDAANALTIAIRSQQIRKEAEDRIAALKHQKPR